VSNPKNGDRALLGHICAFKKLCRQHFDELLPQALELVEEHIDEPCGKTCELVFSDIGYGAGHFTDIVHEDGYLIYRPTITINSQLIDFPDQVRPTISHELAHFVVVMVKHHKGINQTRGHWSHHGKVWKNAAIRLGDDGNRCHSNHALMPAKLKVRALERIGDKTRHFYLTNRKRAKKLIDQPDILAIDIKDSEGFWVSLSEVQG